MKQTITIFYYFLRLYACSSSFHEACQETFQGPAMLLVQFDYKTLRVFLKCNFCVSLCLNTSLLFKRLFITALILTTSIPLWASSLDLLNSKIFSDDNLFPLFSCYFKCKCRTLLYIYKGFNGISKWFSSKVCKLRLM